ncbi:MAG: AAA family ATPase [Methylovulum sp.]|nr:AAA family ATPase [Methylovulum sp.]
MQNPYADSQNILEQLQQLLDAPQSTEDTIATAQHWFDSINKTKTFLEDREHPIAFIGSVGVGKSSLIGVAANLIIGSPPKDRVSLKNNSVLAIGSGRTTVCEVRIRPHSPEHDKGLIGLILDPFTEEEMEKEIQRYAEDEWQRRQSGALRSGEDDIDPTSQEVQRAIRGMTDYLERQESYLEAGVRKRRIVRPLDTAIANFDSANAFAKHLVERANLSERIRTVWWWDKATIENFKALKNCFADINLGTEHSAMLPQRMTLVVPESLPGSQAGLNLTLIDTRGLDGVVESREDLQKLLRDPRALLVLCASFKNAPGDTERAILRSLSNDAQLREAIPRTLLLLLDFGDAEQVNGADGDREYGQELKIDECHIALDGSGLLRTINKTQIIAFDVLKDERHQLLAAIDNGLIQLRETVDRQLREQIEDAKLFLERKADELRPRLRQLVDEQLKGIMAQHLPIDTPLRNPLAGLYRAIDYTRWASVINATCRRNGTYSRLNLYSAIEAEASRAATFWLDDLINAISNKLDALEQDPTFEKIGDDIRLRKMLYQDAQFQVISNYAETIHDQVAHELINDPIWMVCQKEWGRGSGFKERVISHLENWSRKQQRLTAHEHTDAVTIIPLLSEVSRPVQAPSFTIYIRNLRALRRVNWTPETLTVLIGANGAGKTTVLQTLRLLRLAYERGLPEAVSIVLGGSSNLRSWGIDDEEPIEIGLDIDDVSWRIQLLEHEGSVSHLTNERLTERDREIFSRDSLGVFSYGDERIEPNQQLGLKMLMDRGVHEPSVRTIARFLQHISAYHDPDICTLRRGSRVSEDRYLNPRGNNCLSLLRRWYQDKTNKFRYEFVIEGLSYAFPNTFKDMDFQEAGDTLVARIYHPGSELPSPLSDEANGVLQLLILFCEIANAEDESVIAIDEPENSLHPYALREFLRQTTRWAKQHHLTVLLATHSTVLLDEMTGYPEQIYVMRKPDIGEDMPSRLDQFCNREWLEGFKLGDLYEDGEIGSNEDTSTEDGTD